MKINKHTVELDSKIQAEISYCQGDIFIYDDSPDPNEFYVICSICFVGYHLVSLRDGSCWSGVFPTLKDMTREIVEEKRFIKVDSGSILKIRVS